MSLARREEILSRLFELLSTPSLGLVTTVRNRGLLDSDARPAAYLLDGDEVNLTPADNRGRRRMSPGRVALKPQVFVVLKIEKPRNDQIGQDLNVYRKKIISAVANDAPLLALLGANGDLSYDGMETDLKSGATLEGQMRIDFTLIHAFNPYEGAS